jgi:hypothetical protein
MLAKDGFLQLFDGPIPKDLEPKLGNGLIAELKFTGFSMANMGSIVASELGKDPHAKKKGVPKWFLMLSKEREPLCSDVVLDAETIYEGSEVSLDHFIYTVKTSQE